MEPRLKEHVK